MKKILLIDNYDSFTYNLKQLIMCNFNGPVEVRRNDEIDITYIEQEGFGAIVISPGPKKPADSGISNEVIKCFYATKPILGVCLGMQCINEVFGGKTVRSPEPMHGKKSDIIHGPSVLFRDIPEKFSAARYHSLIIAGTPEDLKITAVDGKGLPMAIEHAAFPLFGVQFHPESFMSEYGDVLMKNFLKCLS